MIEVDPRVLAYAASGVVRVPGPHADLVVAALIEHRDALSRDDRVFVIRELSSAFHACSVQPAYAELWRRVMAAMRDDPKETP